MLEVKTVARLADIAERLYAHCAHPMAAARQRIRRYNEAHPDRPVERARGVIAEEDAVRVWPGLIRRR